MNLRRLSSPWRWLAAAALATALMLLGALAESLDPSPPGLTATYFANPVWTPPAALTVRGNQPSTDGVVEAWKNAPPEAFSVRWSGAIITPRGGTYTFATESDDGSSVMIDGHVVVSNDRPHDRASATGSLTLNGGVHRIAIQYVQAGGPFHFDLFWSYDGAALHRVPSWALLSDVAGPARSVLGALVGVAYRTGKWIWFAILIAATLAVSARGLVKLRDLVERHCDWRSLKWVLAASLVLNVAGIWWGLPGDWVPIEQTPKEILGALAQHFAHGVDAYPPLHYYVAIIVMSPMLLLHALGMISWGGPIVYSILALLGRSISLAAGAGIVTAACLCGTRAFNRRAGVLAAICISLTNTFVYYSKTANIDVPYVFWFAVSMVFYLRLLENDRVSDYVWFAVFGAMSIATKDQAYALYLFAPLAIVWRRLRMRRAESARDPWWSAVIDKRIGISAAIVVVLLLIFENPLFNPGGLMAHLTAAVGPASKDYQMFDRTIAGYGDLLALTIHLIQTSLGWPLFIVSLAGVALALVTPRERQAAIWLLVPAVSYYLLFLCVIVYTYERYVLPFCFVLALFAGFALDALLGSNRRWGGVVVAGVVVYGVLYVTTVDALMIGDSRYFVQRWMHANVTPADAVGVTELPVLLPALGDFRTVDVPSVDDLETEQPRYFVLNMDYAMIAPPDTPMGRLVSGLQDQRLGYRRVLRYRWESPWEWLPLNDPALVGPRSAKRSANILRDINPTIEVYERVREGHAPERGGT